MKLINITIFMFCTLTISVAQNNLIHNSSFEDGDSPCKISQVSNMQVWEDDHQFIWNDPVSPCIHYLECSETACAPCIEPHSPDWFLSDGAHARITYSDPPIINGWPTTYYVQARTGGGYVGMFPGELVEQKFFNSNEIVGGKKYTFSMYVQIAKPSFYRFQSSPPAAFPISSILSGFNDNSVLDLNVYLGKNKIKYQQLQISCTWNIFNSTIDDNFKDLSTNSIVLLKNFEISPANYPYHQWHKLTFEFECPSSIAYDYIGIEQSLHKDNLANNGYILIDDVSLVESCELSCYPTSGIPNPIIGTPTAYNVPLQVSNLQNVEKLKLEIFPLTGQSSIYTLDYNYTNGITGNIYWNGEILWGGDAAIGLYICKLTCENECGTHEFSQQFVNVGAMAPYAPNKPLYKIEEKIFNPCCLIDYTLQNKTFSNAKTYQVKENIFVNSNVKAINSSNLNLIAGKNIEILGEFEANSNSAFSATIVECADAHRMMNNVLTDSDFIFYDQLNEAKKLSLKKENFLSIVPNPTSGQFILKSKNSIVNQQNKISILDIFGKVLFFFSNESLKEGLIVDLKGYTNGIYILKYEDFDGNNESIKIIKQD